MAKLPLTSKKSNLAYFCITALLNSLCCTRKCSWHVLFSESRQKLQPFGLDIPYLADQKTAYKAPSLPAHHTQPITTTAKGGGIKCHPPLSGGWLPLVPAWKRIAFSLFPHGCKLIAGQQLGPKWFLSPCMNKVAAGSWSSLLASNARLASACSPCLCTWELLPSKRVFLTC